MMNIEAMIVTHLLANPGQTTAQLAKSTGVRRIQVSKSIGTLTLIGDVFRDNQCRYFVSEPASEGDDSFSILSNKAYRLEEKKLWRRAAEVWLRAMDSTRKEGLRQKAVLRRTHCIVMGSVRCERYAGINSGRVSESNLREVIR